jgi:pimeloyl-ACP methyl ester carboxylesterase
VKHRGRAAAFWMAAVVLIGISAAALCGEPAEIKTAAAPVAAPAVQKGTWNGFERHDLVVDGCAAIVVVPKEAAPGKPWIWRAEFFDHKPDVDLALVAKGFHLVHIKVGNTFGCPDALKHWDAFYKFLTKEYGLAPRAVLEGVSRGGLYCYNWAADNPDKVACIFGDAPVCDFKSWPGGKGKGKGSAGDWAKLQKDYHFASEADALAYTKNPVDNLKPLAEAHIPIIHLCGDIDDVVPVEENTKIIEERYRKLGGLIKVIIKKGVGHVHSLVPPDQIVEFILENMGRAGKKPDAKP